MTEPAAAAAATATAPPAALGCAHYKRKCSLLAPCCNEFFPCRFCHDEVKHDAVLDVKKNPHRLDRHAVRQVKCSVCGNVQASKAACDACGVVFGTAWFCAICNLFDDVDKGQWHCEKCGICRVGGSGEYFHCDTCNSCLALSTRESHPCKADRMKGNCFVCLDDLFSSRDPCVTLRCGHVLHSKCYMGYVRSNYKCGLCGEAMGDMSSTWAMLDLEVALTRMPEEYRNTWVRVNCSDCHEESDARLHIVGMKCRARGGACGSYNTAKVGTAKEEHAPISLEDDTRTMESALAAATLKLAEAEAAGDILKASRYRALLALYSAATGASAGEVGGVVGGDDEGDEEDDDDDFDDEVEEEEEDVEDDVDDYMEAMNRAAAAYDLSSAPRVSSAEPHRGGRVGGEEFFDAHGPSSEGDGEGGNAGGEGSSGKGGSTRTN